jgi:hypothetical protein
MSEWYFAIDGQQQQGPVSEAQLRQMIAAGQVPPSGKVWRQGMPNWAPASQVFGAPAPAPVAAAPAFADDDEPEADSGPATRRGRGRSRRGRAGSSAGRSRAAAPRSPKQAYIASIRSDSAYPTFRSFVNILAILGYLGAALTALAGLGIGAVVLANGELIGIAVIVGGLFYAAIAFFLTRFWKEAASMVADIADTVTDFCSRDDSD